MRFPSIYTYLFEVLLQQLLLNKKIYHEKNYFIISAYTFNSFICTA